MAICTKPNYSTDKFSGDITLSSVTPELSVESIVDIIMDMLKKQNNFSISIEMSDDLNTYEESIDTLIKYINENLPEGIDKSKLLQALEYKLLPKKLNKIEEAITIAIPNSELISEKQRIEITYKEILYNIYGNSNFGIDNWREIRFTDEIQKRAIINIDTETIVDSDFALANNLIDYLELLFKTIKDYLKSDLFKDYSFPQSLYRINPKTKIREKVSTHASVLQAMYNIIESKRTSNTLENELIDGWSKSISNRSDKFYDAVMAYINLVYFDDILRQVAGDFINIDSELDSPIEIFINDDGVEEIVYKYTRAIGNTNLGKNFGVEFEDSLDKLSKFSKVLINAIPVYSYETKLLEYGKLQPKDFIGTWVKLKDVGPRVDNLEFANAVVDLASETSMNKGALQIIFRKLFVDKNNKSLLRNLADLDFNLADLNILYSIYRTVFSNNKKSWRSIENKYMSEKGIKSRYNLVDTLFGIISSNSAMNYLLTIYDSYNKEYSTSVKEKYAINIPKFKIIHNANIGIADKNVDYGTDFTINPINNGWIVTIGNNLYTINIIRDKTLSLLDKDHDRFSVSDLMTVSDLNIDTNNNRYKLLNENNRNDLQLRFIEILSFIDAMLDTNFSSSERGLNEFYLASITNRSFFKLIFLSAARSLYIQDLYKDFRKATKSDGTKYSLTELPQYLSTKNLGIPDRKNPKYRDFFSTQYNGEHLKVIGNNEGWTDTLAKILTILSGDSSRSTISDLLGNKRPNNSPSFLGQELKSQIRKSNLEGEASAYLLFTKNTKALMRMTLDTDIELENGVKKAVRDLTEGELLQNSIIYKFWYPFTKGYVFIQPTTYSDKTKFVRGQIRLKDISYGDMDLTNIIYNSKRNEILEQLMLDTIGEAYKESFKSIINDYRKLLGNNNLTEKEINDFLKNTNEESLLSLVDLYNSKHVDQLEFGENLHYRVINKGLALNELLYEFAKNLYTPERLHSRLLFEKKNFIKDLTSRKVTFKVTELLAKVYSKFTNFEKEWIKNGKLILAKGKLNGELVEVIYNMSDKITDLKLNPILDAYFMVDNLLGNNLRYNMTGFEINHPNKAISKISITKLLNNNIPYIQLLKPDYKDNEELTFYDLDQMIKNYEERKIKGEFNNYTNEQKLELEEFIIQASKLYSDNLYLFENSLQAAQFKRNVAIPATMIRMIPKLNGIGETMKIACIEDVRADVFNFDGKKGKIDSCDGSAQINPFWSILENRSLNDSEVGWVKKPLHHAYDNKTATAVLLKYATNTITNQWMRLSEGNTNGILLRNILKKMTDFKWNFPEEFDLLRCDFKDSGSINFEKDILEGIPLFYKDGLSHYQIVDFNIEDGIYYTIETKVDTFGRTLEEPKKIYHYFNHHGDHIPSLTILNDPRYHTINSLFELHTVLGGIYSETLNKDKLLLYSEASNFAVANFIVHVSIYKPGTDPKDLSIKSYEQPLKDAMIHMIANKTAIKEGSRNINKSSSWFDNVPLRYMTLSTANYGILLDSDHESDQAFMTEFSLVINALDAGGYLHDYVALIYRQLGETALELAEVELSAVREFRESGNKSAIYDIVGRTIMANLRSGRNGAGLAEAIINNIKLNFNLNTDHTLDKLKIPFSDKNIYGSILNTFVSNLNRKSIKRQYPGLGMVIVPSYNISMVYDFEGLVYQFEDLLELAYERGFKPDSALTDISAKNKNVVFLMLNSALNNLPFSSIESFMPTDNVVCYFLAETFNLLGLNTDEVEYEIVKEPYNADRNKPDNDPEKRWKNVLKIYIKGHKELGSFDLVKDQEFGYYSVHFKTGNADTGEIYGSTKEQRNILYQNLYDAIPEGAYVSTYGYVSDKERYALQKLMTRFGEGTDIEIPEKRNIKDRLGNDIDIPIFLKTGTGLFKYEELTTHEKHISLENIEDYYSFVENPEEYLNKRGYYNINTETLKFKKDISRPRNLAPTKISWRYKDLLGNERQMNIFNHHVIKKFIYATWDIENDKSLSNILKKQKILELRKEINPQKVFSDLKRGFFIDEDGVTHKIYDLLNLVAECIMSNIYKSTFGLKDEESLLDVINTGSKYFEKSVKLIHSKNFDLAFTKRSGKHTYITFNTLADFSENFNYRNRKWNNVIRKKENDRMNRIYAVDKNNIILFEVGREIIKDDGTKEYIEFVTRHRVNEAGDNKIIRYDLYNINRDAIRQILNKLSYPNGYSVIDKKTGEVLYTMTEDLKFEKDIDNFISSLLSDIYRSDSFGGVLINKELTLDSGNILKSVLHNFGAKLNYNPELSNYISEVLKLLKETKPIEGYKISPRKLNKLVKEYNKNLSSSIYTSFLRSLYFTSSRIPAQTLQSFMMMRNVGFTGVATGQCFVSRWLTWLLGSKLTKINKSSLPMIIKHNIFTFLLYLILFQV